jgi:hypothetical protein
MWPTVASYGGDHVPGTWVPVRLGEVLIGTGHWVDYTVT